jgi:hypothetical protein
LRGEFPHSHEQRMHDAAPAGTPLSVGGDDRPALLRDDRL